MPPKSKSTKKSRAGNPALKVWCEQQILESRWWRLGGAIACLPCAAIVLTVTWWIIWMALGVGFGGLIQGWMSLTTATWLALGLVFVGYATANFQSLEKMEFESAEHLQVTRFAAYMAGSPWLALAGPKTSMAFVKVISLTLLLGPGLLHLAWRLFQEYRDFQTADPEALARVLQVVLDAGRRVPFADLETAAGDVPMKAWLPTLRMIDGIIVLTSEPAGITLTDSLQNRLAKLPAE